MITPKFTVTTSNNPLFPAGTILALNLAPFSLPLLLELGFKGRKFEATYRSYAAAGKASDGSVSLTSGTIQEELDIDADFGVTDIKDAFDLPSIPVSGLAYEIAKGFTQAEPFEIDGQMELT